MTVVDGLPAKLAAMILGEIFCTLQSDLAANGLRRNPTPRTEAPMEFRVKSNCLRRESKTQPLPPTTIITLLNDSRVVHAKTKIVKELLLLRQ